MTFFFLLFFTFLAHPPQRGKGGGTLWNNIFFNFLVMNLFNKFSMLKKPNLSYIFKLVAGDNYSWIPGFLTIPLKFPHAFWLFNFCCFNSPCTSILKNKNIGHWWNGKHCGAFQRIHSFPLKWAGVVDLFWCTPLPLVRVLESRKKIDSTFFVRLRAIPLSLTTSRIH